MSSRANADRRRSDIQLSELIRISLDPVARRLRRALLQARLRSLQGLVDYFESQEVNAREGLADTHRRIAITQSDLNALR